MNVRFAQIALAIAFGALALVSASPPALAQGSGKFERAQPAAPAPAQPAAPRASFSPAQRELMAKAENKKAPYVPEDCARFPMVPQSAARDYDGFSAKGVGAIREWRTEDPSCAVEQLVAVVSEAGSRCVRVKTWLCGRGWVSGCWANVIKHCKTSSGWVVR
jgi:hypothetical protein